MGSMRLGLVPVGHAAIVGLDLVGVAVVHVDHDRLLEGDGVGDVETIGGAARGQIAAHRAAPMRGTVGAFAEIEAAVKVVLVAGAGDGSGLLAVYIDALPTLQHPHAGSFGEYCAHGTACFLDAAQHARRVVSILHGLV